MSAHPLDGWWGGGEGGGGGGGGAGVGGGGVAGGAAGLDDGGGEGAGEDGEDGAGGDGGAGTPPVLLTISAYLSLHVVLYFTYVPQLWTSQPSTSFSVIPLNAEHARTSLAQVSQFFTGVGTMELYFPRILGALSSQPR